MTMDGVKRVGSSVQSGADVSVKKVDGDAFAISMRTASRSNATAQQTKDFINALDNKLGKYMQVDSPIRKQMPAIIEAGTKKLRENGNAISAIAAAKDQAESELLTVNGELSGFDMNVLGLKIRSQSQALSKVKEDLKSLKTHAALTQHVASKVQDSNQFTDNEKSRLKEIAENPLSARFFQRTKPLIDTYYAKIELNRAMEDIIANSTSPRLMDQLQGINKELANDLGNIILIGDQQRSMPQ